ncbi:MAG TPA: adenylosuccinate synthase [Bacteroidales bacterium]|nr:adenylosuccinate synthase [Bacteroidales bacterium]
MKVDVLLGLQWGDEGKGKIVDVLAPRYDIIARFQGGPNAGHTIIFDGLKFVLHTIPSGIFDESKLNIIGNGVVIDPYIFSKEVEQLRSKNINPHHNLLISKKSHLILPTHRLLDAVYEKAMGKNRIGSTLKGIGPTYTDKTARQGIRVGEIHKDDFSSQYRLLKEKHQRIIDSYNADIADIKIDGLEFDSYEKQWLEAIELLKTYHQTDSEHFINSSLRSGKRILAEGAQGTLLDIEFGAYPFVTSSNTIAAGVCSGLGIAPSKVGRVYGTFKAYCTRVGSGPFPTELHDEAGALMRDRGHEFGSTTGRPRRCGWLDLTALKYSIMLNGITDLVITKGDVLDVFDELKIGMHYKLNGETIDHVPFEFHEVTPVYETIKGWNQSLENITSQNEFPAAFADYISFIQTHTQTPISIVSVGPDRRQTIEV